MKDNRFQNEVDEDDDFLSKLDGDDDDISFEVD